MQSLARTQIVLLTSSSGINSFSRGRACTSMKCSGFCGARSASGYLSALYPAGSRGRTSGRVLLLLTSALRYRFLRDDWIRRLAQWKHYQIWACCERAYEGQKAWTAAYWRPTEHHPHKRSETIYHKGWLPPRRFTRSPSPAQNRSHPPVAHQNRAQILSSSAHSASPIIYPTSPPAEEPPSSHAPPNISSPITPEFLHGAYGSQLVRGASGRERWVFHCGIGTL